jgi:Prohead core protein serine protease
MQRISDLFEPDLAFTVSEASEVDGQNILARVKGTFFVPDGFSRNRRYYPAELWSKCIQSPRVQEKLSSRLMYGTLGHDQPIDEKAVAEGKISHIVTSLSIEGGKGIGEVLVLNTESGRNLNTILRAGSKVFVSSRADGAYKGEHQGQPIVDPNTYVLHTFDFVLDPGFLQANPGLVESNTHLMGDPDMSGSAEALVESISKENGVLRSDLQAAVRQLEESRNQSTVLESQVRALTEKADKVSYYKRLVEQYREVGSPDEVKAIASKLESFLGFFKKAGSPKKIEAALSHSKGLLSRYAQEGSPEEVREALTRITSVIAEYRKLGSVKDLKTVLSRYENVISQNRKAAQDKEIQALATELAVPVESISKVFGKLTKTEIREMFKGFRQSSRMQDRYTQRPAPTSESAGGKDNGDTPSPFDNRSRPRGTLHFRSTPISRSLCQVLWALPQSLAIFHDLKLRTLTTQRMISMEPVQFKRQSEELYNRFRPQMDALNGSLLAKVKGGVDSYDVFALGKQLEAFEHYKMSMREEQGNVNLLGAIPNVA